MKKAAIKIGITIGDPSGIGPEVALKSVNSLKGLDYSPVIIARYEVLVKYYSGLLKEYKIIDNEKALTAGSAEKLIYNITSTLPLPSPGHGTKQTGLESRIYVDKAIDLWKQNLIRAIVTGPVSKSLIEKSGVKFSGHTEYIAGQIKEKNPFMLMYSKEYSVLLVTTHIPVKEIPKKINAGKIYDTILTGNNFLKFINKENASIAIAGLDPHCGDEGAIGKFDLKITAKAVKMAAEQGIKIVGPISADSLFTPGKWKLYGLAIAHYHDQGLIPFKALAFDSGVNVTLGLSVVRTSPDHGTAFDIAGLDKAGFSSMTQAIKMAYLLAEKAKSKNL